MTRWLVLDAVDNEIIIKDIKDPAELRAYMNELLSQKKLTKKEKKEIDSSKRKDVPSEAETDVDVKGESMVDRVESVDGETGKQSGWDSMDYSKEWVFLEVDEQVMYQYIHKNIIFITL